MHTDEISGRAQQLAEALAPEVPRLLNEVLEESAIPGASDLDRLRIKYAALRRIANFLNHQAEEIVTDGQLWAEERAKPKLVIASAEQLREGVGP